MTRRESHAGAWAQDSRIVTGILETVTGESRDGLAVLDADARVVHANASFREIAGAADGGAPALMDLVPVEETARVSMLLDEVALYGRTAAVIAFKETPDVPVRLERARGAGSAFTVLVMERPREGDVVDPETRRREAKITTAILQTARASASARNPRELCQLAVEAFFDVYPAPIVVLHLVDRKAGVIRLVAADGESRAWLGRPWNLPLSPESPSPLVQAILQKKTIVKDRLDMVRRFVEFEPFPEGEVTPEEVQAAFARLQIRTVADVPIVFENQVLGVIGMGSSRETVDESVVHLLELLAHEIAAGLNRLNLEAARERLLEATREAHRELADFTYNVSHDLSEEMRRVITFTESLAQDYGDEIPEDATDLARRAHAIAQALQARVKGSLEFAQLLRHDALEPERVALESHVDAAVERARRRHESARARFHLTHPLPDAWADPSHLGVILDNLLDNAVRFNPKPERNVWVSGSEVEDAVELIVDDDGPGVPPEYREHVFQAFRKRPEDERHVGSGMGLTLVARLVARHGGTVSIEDRSAGPGARFRVRFPEPHSAAHAGAWNGERGSAGSASQPPSKRP